MRAMTVSETRANFGRALDEVVEDRIELVISRKAGDVVLVARDEYDSLVAPAQQPGKRSRARPRTAARR